MTLKAMLDYSASDSTGPARAPQLSRTLEWLKARAMGFRHKAYVRLFSGVAPYFVVNEYPKSGGTWLALMLAEATGLPFHRDGRIRFEPSVTHGHFLNPFRLDNIVVMWRDPRDMLVSLYFHCYFVNEHGNSLVVRLMRERSRFEDYDDVKCNLPNFIRILSRRPVSPKFSWPRFAAIWMKREDETLNQR